MQRFPDFWARLPFSFLESSLGISFCGEYFALLVLSFLLLMGIQEVSLWLDSLLWFVLLWGFWFYFGQSSSVLTLHSWTRAEPHAVCLTAPGSAEWPACPSISACSKLISWAPETTSAFSVSSILSETLIFVSCPYSAVDLDRWIPRPSKYKLPLWLEVPWWELGQVLPWCPQLSGGVAEFSGNINLLHFDLKNKHACFVIFLWVFFLLLKCHVRNSKDIWWALEKRYCEE